MAPGTRYYHRATGEDHGGGELAVDAYPVSGPPYRDFALFLQDEDEVIGTAQMPYREQVHGLVGLNYGKEPLARRLAANKDTARLFRSAVHGDPAAPLLEAFAGDRVRLHSLVPFSEQAHVFSLEGHRWPLEPGRWGTDMQPGCSWAACPPRPSIWPMAPGARPEHQERPRLWRPSGAVSGCRAVGALSGP